MKPLLDRLRALVPYYEGLGVTVLPISAITRIIAEEEDSMAVDKRKEVPNPNSWLSEGFNMVQYPVRHILDEDCPTCGYPEMGAVGKDFTEGALRFICRHCGYDKPRDEFTADLKARLEREMQENICDDESEL